MVNTGRFEVRRSTGADVTMGDGRREPAQWASIWDTQIGGYRVRDIMLNCTTMCLPEGGVRGVEATDEQIIRAVMGDEDVFTGEPTYRDTD